MSGREVVGIRTDTINVPEPHEHVIAIKLVDGTILQQGEAIEAMRDGEDLHVRGDLVHVHTCPTCGSYPYLTAPGGS